jgi:hypothetical protein
MQNRARELVGLKEILEEKKNELSPHSKIPPFFPPKSLWELHLVLLKINTDLVDKEGGLNRELNVG